MACLVQAICMEKSMAENSKIEWTDHTFNPFIGCTKISPGCDNCYAEHLMDKRMHKVIWGPKGERVRTSASNWRKPLAWNANHAAFFAEHGRRQRVFCASLADVFDNAVDPQWREDLFKLIEATPNLDWLLLTKRIGNVGNMLPVPFDFAKLYPHVWIGATVVNQEEADRDIPKLIAVDAAVRFLSMEPLLGPVDLEYPKSLWPDGPPMCCSGHECGCKGKPADPPLLYGIDWVIVGGESGPGARPMHPDWARSLRDQCQSVGVPFLFKQWGEWIAPSQHGAARAENGFAPIKEFAMVEGQGRYHLVGKKAAGRQLDGRTWDEVPTP